MSDFFQRLAGRALKTLPTLQPKLPTRFEPIQRSLASATELEQSSFDASLNTNEAFTALARPHDRSIQKRDLIKDRIAPQPAVTSTTTSTVPAESNLDRPNQLARPMARQVDTPTAASSESSSTGFNSLTSQIDSAQESIQPSTTRVIPNVVLVETVSRPAHAAAIDSESNSVAESVNEPIVRQPDPELGDLLAGHKLLPNEVSSSTTIQPKVTPVDEPKSPSLTAPAVPQAPAIQISIGKIEVRGSAPNHATSRPTRKTSVVMSLDDYLRQRSRDQR